MTSAPALADALRARAAALRPRLPSMPAARLATVADIGAWLLVALLALRRAAPLIGAADLATGGGDWAAHLYRVHHLAARGLASWTFDWAGGLPLWSSYQFAPHAAVLAISRLTATDPARVMTAAQAALLVWLPLATYVLLRRAGLRSLPSLLAALLVLALDRRTQAVATFSELWGLALAPPLLWGAWVTAGRRRAVTFAALAGAAVYIHPLAAATGILAMCAAYVRLIDRRAFRQRARTARLGALLAAQAAAALTTTAFFLWPLVESARPVYQQPYFLSTEFGRLLARLSLASYLPGWPLWLTLAAAGAAFCAVRGRGERRRAACYLLLMGMVVTALCIVSAVGDGQRPILALQLPRLLSLLPLLAAAAAAVAWERVPPSLGGRRAARWYGPAAVALLTALLLVRDPAAGLPAARSATAPASSFTRWLIDHPAALEAGQRVAAAPVTVADASAFAYGRAWYAASYSGRDWSILAGPLALFMEGFGAADTRAAYLTAMAVDLAVVPPGVRPPLATPGAGVEAAWIEVARLDGADVLRLPWRAPLAFTAPAGAADGLEVPDAAFTTIEEAYVRDELTRATPPSPSARRGVAGPHGRAPVRRSTSSQAPCRRPTVRYLSA
ncbi:MAG: hypothetical protein U0531_19150 [Dehalococcoidia bacterium]